MYSILFRMEREEDALIYEQKRDVRAYVPVCRVSGDGNTIVTPHYPRLAVCSIGLCSWRGRDIRSALLSSLLCDRSHIVSKVSIGRNIEHSTMYHTIFSIYRFIELSIISRIERVLFRPLHPLASPVLYCVHIYTSMYTPKSYTISYRQVFVFVSVFVGVSY